MKTVEDAKAWLKENREECVRELKDFKDAPDYMKEPGGRFEDVWCVGCWLNEELREAGASEEEVSSISIAHGQRSFFGDTYKWGVAYLNEFIEKGEIKDKSGIGLADEINAKHIHLNGDVVGITVEEHKG